MVDWNKYLESVCEEYAIWGEYYSPTEVTGGKKEEFEDFTSPLDFQETDEQELDEEDEGVEGIEQITDEQDVQQSERERIDTIEGLRKHIDTSRHILLLGRPGAGKSITLVKLLLEEAQKAQINSEVPIPILIELRYWHGSILERIKAFLQRHDPDLVLEEQTLKTLLLQRRLLLLLDGLNELPDKPEAKQDIIRFEQDYQKTLMVFTTRSPAIHGDLGIDQKLEIQPLTTPQKRRFAKTYLKEKGDHFVNTYLKEKNHPHQKDRFQELAETPLLLWILCEIFSKNQSIPKELGPLLQKFTRLHQFNNSWGKNTIPLLRSSLKGDVAPSSDRRLWPKALECLSSKMMQGEVSGGSQCFVSRSEAEQALRQLFQNEPFPDRLARDCLEDLLNFHLIQPGSSVNQIEFHHQLIQSYYAAEFLLKKLDELNDVELQQNYLRYLKWSEPIELMLSISECKEKSLRIIKLALEIDLRFGARLVRWIVPDFQKPAVKLVEEQKIHQLLKIQLLSRTESVSTISTLTGSLDNRKSAEIRQSAIHALGRVDSRIAVSHVVNTLQDNDAEVRKSATYVLGKIGSKKEIVELSKALDDSDDEVRRITVQSLSRSVLENRIDPAQVVPSLVKVLKDKNYDVRKNAVYALGRIGLDEVIPKLTKILESDIVRKSDRYKHNQIRQFAAHALTKIGSESAINELVKILASKRSFSAKFATNALGKSQFAMAGSTLIKALTDKDYSVRKKAARALGNIGSEEAIAGLTKGLEDETFRDVRKSIAHALGRIGSERATEPLVKVLRDKNEFLEVRKSAAHALGDIGSDKAISPLVQVLSDREENAGLRKRAAYTLNRIASEDKEIVAALIDALNDVSSEHEVHEGAAYALGRFGSRQEVPLLVKNLNHPSSTLRKNVVYALGRIAAEEAIEPLINVLENDLDSDVKASAAIALANTNSEHVIEPLVKKLNHPDSTLRKSIVYALGRVATKETVDPLIDSLKNDQDPKVQSNAAINLGNIISKSGDTDSKRVVELLVHFFTHHDSFEVRKNIVLALSKFESEAAVFLLVNALGDKDLKIRKVANEILRRMKPELVIPRLIQFVESEDSVAATSGRVLDYAMECLIEIQEGYPSYDLSVTESAISSPSQSICLPKLAMLNPPVHILHLSDLHFGTSTEANLWSGQLADDLRELKLSHLDALILSGDIANRSTPEEYDAAQQFLVEFCQDFPLKPEQIIIVPGNHDLNWIISEEEGYEPKLRRIYQGKIDKDNVIDDGGNYIAVINPEQYPRRFQPFSQFYQAIKGKAYPIDPNQQYTIDRLSDHLLILGLNSAWQLDHHYKTRVSINDNALTNALRDINRTPDYKNCSIKIAVWHHPIHSAGDDRIRDSNFLERLAVNGFRFFLHGHIHQAQKDFYDYDSERGLFRICAGTFGAPTKELTTAIPWQYHLLKFAGNQLTIRSRKRASETGAWESDYCWRYPKNEKRDSYQINLISDTAQNPQ